MYLHKYPAIGVITVMLMYLRSNPETAIQRSNKKSSDHIIMQRPYIHIVLNNELTKRR